MYGSPFTRRSHALGFMDMAMADAQRIARG
jgi:hypothetical protein